MKAAELLRRLLRSRGAEGREQLRAIPPRCFVGEANYLVQFQDPDEGFNFLAAAVWFSMCLDSHTASRVEPIVCY